MTNSLHYLALFTAILMTVGSQVTLKIGANRPRGSVNIITLTGLAMLGMVTVLMVFVLQAIFLKTVIALNALTFVAMPLAAKVFLGEEMTRRGIMGSIVIVIGIIVFLYGG
jgi:undecaprenyl phosphate-alpha-L-ara4N flippase subunit ArnE